MIGELRTSGNYRAGYRRRECTLGRKADRCV